jgi:PKD domain-containing protein
VPQAKATRYAVLFVVSILGTLLYSGLPPVVHAATSYTLTPLPYQTQEGYSTTLILDVYGALPSTVYKFNFYVRDPSTKIWGSIVENYTTLPGQTQFALVITYPSAAFVGIGTNSLVGQYVGWANQVTPLPPSNPVAATPFGFLFTLTDKYPEYQRTDTVGIRANGYNASETATIIIRTQTTSTVVLNATTTASSAGLVTGSWKIPRNAVLDNYLVTVTGKTTAKNPADAQGFIVRAASMSISALTSGKTSYQRTETMIFSFKPSYPDGQYANTGTALVILTGAGGNSVSLTAVYDSVSQTFNATYKTLPDNQTGTWTASLRVNGFDDGFGNTGPSTAVTSSPQLQPATLIITITSKPYFAIGEQIKFNATIQYPDLSNLQSGQVGAFLLFSGGGHNDTIPVVYDSTLKLWVGTYTPGNEPGGLWSLTVAGADSASPANTGKATKTVQLQDRIPVSIFTFTSGTILTSTPVSFDGTASFDPDGTIVGYAWDFGDGSTGSGATTSHAYSFAGTYDVKLNVTDNSGSTNLSTQTVAITDRPPVVTLTQSATTATSGQAVIITISASDPDGTIANATVNWGDGTKDTIVGTPTTDSHAYSLANAVPSAAYTITVTVYDNSGSTTSTTSKQITVQPIQSSSNVSFPLYYFGILAALISALLIGVFLAFRRHKVTHAKLKIDLEAVKAEAGRIENQEFFQSVKDQLKKDKE